MMNLGYFFPKMWTQTKFVCYYKLYIQKCIIKKKKSEKTNEKVDTVHKDEFMAVMEFSESKQFMDWFMNLPEDSPISLKGEIIYFNSIVIEKVIHFSTPNMNVKSVQ